MKLTLNLVSPSKSDLKFSVRVYPDSQPHIIIERPDYLIKEVSVIIAIRTPTDLLISVLIADILHRWDVDYTFTITYLLGARMDRIMSLNEPNTLKVIRSVLPCYDCNVFCPHSPQHGIYDMKEEQLKFFEQVIDDIDEPELVLISPDEGARERTLFFGRAFNRDVVTASKQRDLTTGKLSNPKLLSPLPDGKKVCLITDDLCDGGRTFVNLLGVLKEAGAEKVYLAVCHGIFSAGLVPLQEFAAVYTTNSYYQKPSELNLKVIDLF